MKEYDINSDHSIDCNVNDTLFCSNDHIMRRKVWYLNQRVVKLEATLKECAESCIDVYCRAKTRAALRE